ncbi:MAG: hypothetical protein PHH54_04440 [Candidatus Nanoarchaeia archaeon]|nr:hypothetical protein [Candidatus Nanoarchaeia archaeon]MDD5741208.1 hypothetical protein [Candidatus Nanoarchaeia archaeon]
MHKVNSKKERVTRKLEKLLAALQGLEPGKEISFTGVVAFSNIFDYLKITRDKELMKTDINMMTYKGKVDIIYFPSFHGLKRYAIHNEDFNVQAVIKEDWKIRQVKDFRFNDLNYHPCIFAKINGIGKRNQHEIRFYSS